MVVIKRKLIRSIATFIYESGLLSLINRLVNVFQLSVGNQGRLEYPFIRQRRSCNVQILLYHRVNDLHDPFFCGTPPAVFERQMEYLAKHFRPCSLDTALDELARKDVPPNSIVVTFDDGYKDNFLHAFPILRKFGIPATIFLATGAIDEGPCLWFDRVFQAFRETEEERLYGYGNPSMSCPLNTLQQKLDAQDRVLRFLRSVSDDDKAVWIKALCEKLKVEEKIRRPGLMLSWDEVRAMAQDGISFGAHTVHHPILSRVTSRQVREEVVKSREVIEKELGISVTSFAYPNGATGDFNESTKEALRDAGYRCAVTTIAGTNDSNQDLFELRRGTPWDHDAAMFALRLNYLKWAS